MVATTLKRVGRAIARHGEITMGRRAANLLLEHPPVVAAALLSFGIGGTPEQVADRLRVVLAEPDDRPALGWLRFIRDFLWPLGVFANPLALVEDIEWAGWGRVHTDDLQGMQYLLRPTAVPSNLAALFPEWRAPKPNPPTVAGVTAEYSTAAESVEVRNTSESGAADVPVPPNVPDPLTPIAVPGIPCDRAGTGGSRGVRGVWVIAPTVTGRGRVSAAKLLLPVRARALSCVKSEREPDDGLSRQNYPEGR